MSVWKSTAKLTPAVDNRLKTLEETIHEYEIYHLITEGTTGSVEKPTHGDIIMDQYPAGGDCIIVKTDSTTQKPIEALVYDASGVLVEGTLDINGNYILSGVPATYPVAIVFQVSLAEMYKTLELSNDKILNEMQIPNVGVTSHEDLSNISQAGTGVLDGHISDQAQTIAGDKTYSGTAVFNEAVTFKGDIIQQGTGKITYTEDVRTKNDLITLRDGAITGLDIGEYTGLKAKLYDGVNDGLFVIDRDGYFKVGDEGNLVTLTGREDSPIDQAFGYWDDTTKIFKTKTISSSDLTDNSSIVKTSGIQTIEGVKTFSSSPIVPDATTATQAVSKGQLDTVDLKTTPIDCSSRVAEYTGDGIPLIPDNVEGTTYVPNFATIDSWYDNNSALSVANNILKVTASTSSLYGTRRTLSALNTKLFRLRIRTSRSTTVYARYYNGSAFPIISSVQTVAGVWTYLDGYLASGSTNSTIYIDTEDGANTGDTFEISQENTYIGNGKYDTPALDRSGNGNNLTLKAVTPVNGKYGKEMLFNGYTSYAQASSPVIRTTGTISIRLKPASLSAVLRPFGNRRVGVAGGVTGYIYADTGVFEFNVVKSDGSLQEVTAGSVSVTEYKSFTFTWDGTTIKAYRDGILVNSVAQLEPATVAIDNLSIGRMGNYGADYFNGIISHFRYDSRIWTADEARAWSLNPSVEDSLSMSETPSSGDVMVWPENASGTFTPTLSFGGASEGITYSVRSGRYIKSSGMIHFWVHLRLTSKGTSVGGLTVSGIPPKSAETESAVFNILANGVSFGGYLCAYMNSGETGTIYFESENADGSYSAITNANCSDSIILYITGIVEA